MAEHILAVAAQECWNSYPVTIIEPTDEAADEFGHGYGSCLAIISPANLEALQQGKMLAWSDGESSTFVVLKLEGE